MWSFKIAFKVSIGMTPFRLAYGLKAVVPMEFVVPSLRVSAEKLPSNLSVRHKTRYLMQMEEEKMVSAYIA